MIVDLDRPSQQIRIATGGAGGRGNVNFKSGYNRAPRQFTCGEYGEEKWVELELKYVNCRLYAGVCA